MIAITDLAKAYGPHRVLRGLSFAAEPGEVALLVGANGCGKSTTLRLLAGLAHPDAGRIVLGGHDAGIDPVAARAGLSFLPQSPHFHERLTVGRILAFYARLRGLPASRIDVVAARWGLVEYLGVATGRLSGGTRQRLGLAILDLPDAPILVLDEPGLSLDPDWRQALYAHLRRVAARGRTVLVATHLLGEWDGQADRCLVIDHGQLDRELPPARLRDAFPFTCPQPALAGAN